LAWLCAAEVARKDQLRMEMALRLARFTYVRTLEAFDFEAQPSIDLAQIRHLSGKKPTRGAGLSAFHILQHEADQWSRIRATIGIVTNICMGIQASLLRVTSFKAAKQFIGNKQKGWMASC
jgi:hypothetical protein